MPHIYHNIKVTNKATGSTHTFKHYKFGNKWGPRGETWWSTYRYQLEAFIDKVRGKTPAYWIDPEDIVAEAELIDAIYVKSGLGQRHSLNNAQ
jgi:predicted dehydrogenase